MASLTDILVLEGVLAPEHVARLGRDRSNDAAAIRTLLSDGAVTSAQVARARATQANLPFVELLVVPIDRAAVAGVAPSLCRRHEVLPLSIADGRVTLAMWDPGNVVAIDDVRTATRLPVDVVVADRADLLSALDRFLRADEELNDLTDTLEEESVGTEEDGRAAIDSFDDDAPIVRFVNLLVSQAIQDLASDIHIEPTASEVRVRYRIDGVLHEMQSAPRASRTA